MSGIRDAWENARGWAARLTSREPAQPEVQCEWGDHHLHDAGMVDDLGQCPGLPREPQFDRQEWEEIGIASCREREVGSADGQLLQCESVYLERTRKQA